MKPLLREYSKVRIKSTGGIGTIVEFDPRDTGAIHLVELTGTSDDDRVLWADASDLEELPPDVVPSLDSGGDR